MQRKQRIGKARDVARPPGMDEPNQPRQSAHQISGPDSERTQGVD
jgi:hypothetical protein